MPIKIEFGRLNRGENSPVYVKQKTSEGSPLTIRIYQRKDLDTVANPFSKMLKAMKYHLEDFCIQHEKAGKFFEFFGLKRIDQQVTINTKELIDVSTKIETDARLGKYSDQTNFDKLSGFLKIKSQNNKYDINIIPDKYDDSNFLQDLTQNFLTQRTVVTNTIENLDELRSYFEDCKQKIGDGNPIITDADSLKKYFKNCSTVRQAIAAYSNIQEVNKSAAEAFMKKFDEVFPQDFGKLFNHKEMKNAITNHLNDRLGASHNESELAEKIKEAIESFDKIFSNSANLNRKEKYLAMLTLRNKINSNEPCLNILDAYMETEMRHYQNEKI